MRKNMQKRTAFFAVAFVFALVICGAVSAADTSNATATTNSTVAAPASTTTPAASSTPTTTNTTTAAPAASTTPATTPAASTTPATTPAASTTPATTSSGDPYIIGSPIHYQTIQDAVNAAIKGDTIVVECGVYSGLGNSHVVINKMLTLIGAPGTVVVGNGIDPVFDVIAGGSKELPLKVSP